MCSLDDKLARIHALENGKGLQYLLNEAFEILENPSLVFNLEYTFIAAAEGVVTDDRIWNEFVTQGQVSPETVDFFLEEGFIDEAANSYDIIYLSSDKIKYPRLFGRLYNDEGMPAADLVTVACVKPFEEGADRLVEALCAVITKELSRSAYYHEYGQTYQERIVKELIDWRTGDKTVYADHLANLYRGLRDNIFLAVADASRHDPDGEEARRIRDLLKRAAPHYKFAVYGGHILCLISTEHEKLNVKRDLGGLTEQIERENLHVGISGPFGNLFELGRYYLEAREALQEGLRKGEGERIFFCEGQ